MGTTTTGRTGRGRAAHGAMQRAKALEMRAAGATYRMIGDALGISRQAAAKHVAKALAELDDSTRESARQLRRLEGIRLDAILRASWPKRDELEHAKIILEVSKRRARLEGLDAPERQEITGRGGTPLLPAPPPEPEPNFDLLTVEQLRTLEELLRLAGIEATRASQIAPDGSVYPALPPTAASATVEVPAARAEPIRVVKPPAVE